VVGIPGRVRAPLASPPGRPACSRPTGPLSGAPLPIARESSALPLSSALCADCQRDRRSLAARGGVTGRVHPGNRPDADPSGVDRPRNCRGSADRPSVPAAAAVGTAVRADRQRTGKGWPPGRGGSPRITSGELHRVGMKGAVIGRSAPDRSGELRSPAGPIREARRRKHCREERATTEARSESRDRIGPGAFVAVSGGSSVVENGEDERSTRQCSRSAGGSSAVSRSRSSRSRRCWRSACISSGCS